MEYGVACKVACIAYDMTTGALKTGDAANISAYVSKNCGAVTQLTGTSATELDPTNAKGAYWFDVTATENNAVQLLFTFKSSTANVQIDPLLIYPTPANFPLGVVDSSGYTGADIRKVKGTTVTGSGTAGSPWGP